MLFHSLSKKTFGLLLALLFLSPQLFSYELFAKENRNPQILSYSASLPYIKVVRSFPWKLRIAFGWQDQNPELLKFVFSDSLSIQVFQFLNARTALCFTKLSYAGVVIFKTGTDSIVTVYPWSERVKQSLTDGFDSDFYFYNSGYTFEDNGTFWRMYLYTLVMIDGDFQVWHFDFDLANGGFGSGRTDILIEKPSRSKKSSNK